MAAFWLEKGHAIRFGKMLPTEKFLLCRGIAKLKKIPLDVQISRYSISLKLD
jgi:hypothetical protein